MPSKNFRIELNRKTKAELSNEGKDKKWLLIWNVRVEPAKHFANVHWVSKALVRRAWCDTRELCCTACAQGPARVPDHCPRRWWGLGWCSFRCAPACSLNCQLPVSIQITHCGGEGGGKKERKKSRSIVFFFSW